MDFKSLEHSNRLAFYAHLFSAITVIILYARWPATHSRSAFQTYQFDLAGPTETCKTDAGAPSQCNIEFPLTVPKTVISINVVYGSIAFFLITAFAHSYYMTDGFGSGNYAKVIRDGWNPYRWFEYASSASIMTALIALTDGVRDIQNVVGLVIVTAALQFCGFIVESLLRGNGPIGRNSRDAIWASTFVGWTLYLIIWGTFLWTFATLINDLKVKYAGELVDGKPVEIPIWIWFIVFGQAIYYALFGFVQLSHIHKRLGGSSYNFISTEKSYIALSFFAKLSLASGLAYGVLWRTKDC